MYNEVLKDTWNQLVINRTAIFKGILIPFIVLVCLEFLVPVFGPQSIAFSSFLILFISVVVYLYIAITVHRVLIMGPKSVSTWGNSGLSQREISYFIKMVLLVFMIAIPIFFVVFLGGVLKIDKTMISFLIISAIIAAVLVSRYSLVFPAIATDEELTFSDSWKLTKNYKLLTFITIAFFPFILTFLVGGAYALVIQFLMKGISSYFAILMVPLNVFINVVTIACLSSTYKFIKEQNREFFEPVVKNEIKPAREIEVQRNDTTIKKLIDVNHNVTFESLKQDLIAQYEPLGFVNTVINRAESWMVKNPDLNGAYVLLVLKEGNYTVETYNTQEANIVIMD